MAGQLAAQLETRVFDTKIRSGVAIAEAPAHGESIFEYSPRASAVKDYGKFLDEVKDHRFQGEIVWQKKQIKPHMC